MSCLSKLPKCLKAQPSPKPSPERGLYIDKQVLAKIIVLPLLLVGTDILSDGGVLLQMLNQILTVMWTREVNMTQMLTAMFREVNQTSLRELRSIWDKDDSLWGKDVSMIYGFLSSVQFSLLLNPSTKSDFPRI